MKLVKTLIILLIGFGPITQAQNDCLLDSKPQQTLVVDQVGILSKTEKIALENKLLTFEKRSSVQILVAIVNDLCGYDKASFSYKLGEEWGVGDKEFDNGLVVMVKPTGGRGERHTFIATGYGLEAVIPDATAKRIVEVEMIPQFKEEKYLKGLNSATDILMSLALKEYKATDYDKKHKRKAPIIPGLLILFVFFIIIVTRVRAVRRHAIGHDIPFWTALWMMSNHRHRSGGGWSDFHSGGGNFGGFGGFGGGSFGGGGAGGSW